jgi:ribose transport system permease protein
MQSIKSQALEPTHAELASMSRREALAHLIPVYGLPILGLWLLILFSLILPRTFPTLLNLRGLLSDKSIIALLALGSTLPMMVGRLDLTVGYGIVLWHILAISLQTIYGLPWWASVALVLAGGAALGMLNGMLVELAQVDSFIATLGTGTIIYAIALWHTEGRQVLGSLPDAFLNINGRFFLGLPIATYYVAVVAVVMWVVTERLPLGRKLYAIGANSKAAALNGIPVTRYVIGTFVASGFLTAFAGVLLASKMHVGQTSVGLEFLLPALVGAFLGTTTIKPGRVNVLGTIFGVVVLAIGISGLQQLGGAFYVEPLFNGCTLIGAIVLAGYAQRLRTAMNRSQMSKAAAIVEEES